MTENIKKLTLEIAIEEGKKPHDTFLNNTNPKWDEFTTVEYYPITRLIVLHNYLKDFILEKPIFQTPRTKSVNNKFDDSVAGQVRLLGKILNLSDEYPHIINKDELIILNGYGYKTKHCKGRLFGRLTVMPQLSRQCRYYLFHDRYYDVDLVNAHPSMIMFYGQSNNIECPILEEYVKNREPFLADIMQKTNQPRSEAKKSVLRTINLSSMSKVDEGLEGL